MSLIKRALNVFVSPGELGDWLAERPVWVDALLLSVVFGVVAQALLPLDIQVAAMRNAIIERGGEVPDDLESLAGPVRWVGVVGTGVVMLVWALILSGITMFIFSFLLGDKGTYRQYLSAATHSIIIPALGALVITPLRIRSRDPALVLSPGSVLGDLVGDGYLQAFLSRIDVFAVWGTAVLAILVTRIDKNRSFPVAFGALFALQLIVAAVVATFI